MKTTVYLSVLGAALLGTSGCFTYERRSVPTTTTYVEPAPGYGSQRVVTVLPSGYRTRVVSGTTYYYSGNTYYRSAPRGGYVVVNQRPW